MVGASLKDALAVEVSGHCGERHLRMGRSSSLSGVDLGVILVGSSAMPTDGEASFVLVPDCSVIADRGEVGMARSGIAFSIFLCLRVLGRMKECGEKEARKLRRRF